MDSATGKPTTWGVPMMEETAVIVPVLTEFRTLAALTIPIALTQPAPTKTHLHLPIVPALLAG